MIYIYMFLNVLIVYLLLFLMCLIEPTCQRKMFIFMLCILMSNKDLFDLIDLYIHRPMAEAGSGFQARSKDQEILEEGGGAGPSLLPRRDHE